MKILSLFFLVLPFYSFAQQEVIDVVGMRQLISESKDEHTAQVKARNQQAANTTTEASNMTLLAKLKNTYRTLQQRYNALGTAIDIAEIGISAKPMVTQIVRNQAQIVALTEKNPAIIALGYQTEIEFAEKAEALIGYITGLTLSLGDVNQMKASDRKILFDYVIQQLSKIQELSGNMLRLLQYSNLASVFKALNPFESYISQDKNMVEHIIQNAKYLK
ncbi:MAG: hypothetical protein ACHQHN_04355 [Sphingobacteriales bacterium]